MANQMILLCYNKRWGERPYGSTMANVSVPGGNLLKDFIFSDTNYYTVELYYIAMTLFCINKLFDL